ncbi:MAG: hypothetical protein QOJ55_26 [Solirubrobacteraceae bacterium]|nr:hypothetical protein [Solirubrobacteraceae bacterium]
MRRWLAGPIMVACLAWAAPAASAATPAVLTGSATSISNTGATLNGTVRAGGQPPSYAFQYGLSSAYTKQTPAHSAGSGFVNVRVKAAITRLIPGTVYHFRIVAVNASGLAVGADRTFKTTGHPPPGVFTGPAVNVTRSTALLTGAVSTGGLSTTYHFDIGTSPFNVAHTNNVTLAGTNNNVTVSAAVGFLGNHTLYHYRLVASNASGTQTGADQVFVTSRFAPGLTRNATPRHLRRRPFLLTVGGTLQLPAGFPPLQACQGVVQILVQKGSRTVVSTRVFVGGNCRYGTRINVPRSVSGTAHVRARFLGNALLTPHSAKTQNVQVG